MRSSPIPTCGGRRPPLGGRRIAATAAAALLCTACFGYAPARTIPQPGKLVAFEITDEGRSALTATLGPGVVRLEGTLVALEGDDYLVDADAATTTVRRVPTPLDGVRVRLSPRDVARVEEWRLSRRRTYPVLGGTVAVVTAFFITRGLVGRGTPPEGGPTEPPTNQ